MRIKLLTNFALNLSIIIHLSFQLFVHHSTDACLYCSMENRPEKWEQKSS